MTARFEAFKAALHALCVEHGVYLYCGYSDDHDGCTMTVEHATEDRQAGCDYVSEIIPPTPEELAERAARAAEWEKQRREEARLWRLSQEQRLAEIHGSAEYRRYAAVIEADAAQQRERQMRVSTDPNDPAFIDARPRKVWVNEQLIEGWTVADEFRRVVITPEKVHHGAVLIERLPDAPVPIEQLPRVQQESRPAKRRR